MLPGVVEEIFFRGLLFGCLRLRYPAWFAMFVSSGLFALAHLSAEMVPLQMLSLGLSMFLAGSVYALAYARTGTLYAAILAHVLFDAVPVAGLTMTSEQSGVVAQVVIFAGYFAAFGGLLLPSMQRWATLRDQWPFPQAYLKGIEFDARSLWATATRTPPPYEPVAET